MYVKFQSLLEDISYFLKNPPFWGIVSKNANLLNGFDINSEVDFNLSCFVGRQYNLTFDVYILLTSDRSEFKAHSTELSSLWGMANIVAAIVENLIIFAWLASDFDYRSKLFKNFSCIEDLELFPTNKKIRYADTEIDIDQNILTRVKSVADIFKTSRSTLKQDIDFIKRENYVQKWYHVEKNRGIKDLAKEVTINIKLEDKKENFIEWYNRYKRLCDLKHISSKESTVHLWIDDIEVINSFVDDFKWVLSTYIKAFYVSNMILISVLNDKNIKLDDNLQKLQEHINNNKKFIAYL